MRPGVTATSGRTLVAGVHRAAGPLKRRCGRFDRIPRHPANSYAACLALARRASQTSAQSAPACLGTNTWTCSATGSALRRLPRRASGDAPARTPRPGRRTRRRRRCRRRCRRARPGPGIQSFSRLPALSAGPDRLAGAQVHRQCRSRCLRRPPARRSARTSRTAAPLMPGRQHLLRVCAPSALRPSLQVGAVQRDGMPVGALDARPASPGTRRSSSTAAGRPCFS